MCSHTMEDNVKTVEQPRSDRVVNKALIDWTMSTPDFQQARASAVGNLPAAMVSSGFLWASLTTEEALQDALKKQDEAAKKEEELTSIIRTWQADASRKPGWSRGSAAKG